MASKHETRSAKERDALSFDDGPAPADQYVALDLICEGNDKQRHSSVKIWRFRAWTHEGSEPPTAAAVSVISQRGRLPGQWVNPADGMDAGHLMIDADCPRCHTRREVPLDSFIVSELRKIWAPGAHPGPTRHVLS